MSKQSNRMNRMAGVVLALGLAVGGIALAQDPPKRDSRSMGHGPMSGGMMGMGGGMGGMMGMCPMMTPGAQMKVQKIDDGISISITSSDPQVAARIQKRGEIMRLMHELQEEEPQR